MNQSSLFAAHPPIEFSVSGAPVPQGSKTGYIRGGRVVLVDVQDKATQNRPANWLKAWRCRVAYNAKVAINADPLWNSQPIWRGPVMLECEFVVPRSASHYTGTGKLTSSAPMIPRRDLDKLLRAVGDALTGIAYHDDVQIVGFGATTKRFAGSRTAVGGVRVKVSQL